MDICSSVQKISLPWAYYIPSANYIGSLLLYIELVKTYNNKSIVSMSQAT